jgi:nucleotide-binding universal stress UspA family protein
MLDRILVPLDGSVTAEAIVPHLRRLLRRLDSEVILLRATEAPLAELPPVAIEAALGAAREYLLGQKERLEQEGVRVRVEARLGPAAGTILEVAREQNASLIAMATHGRTGLTRALFGSVAEHVLLKCTVPVLAVRPFWSYDLLPAPSKEGQPFRRILLPLDESAASTAVLGPALELAKLFEASLVFLHIAESAKKGKTKTESDPHAPEKAWLEKAAREARSQGLETLSIVEEGEAPSAILENARRRGCDLIAMTTHGRSGIGRLAVGSVTEKVLRNATLPLLVVRAAKEDPKKPARKAAKTRS